MYPFLNSNFTKNISSGESSNYLPDITERKGKRFLKINSIIRFFLFLRLFFFNQIIDYIL